MNGSSRSTHRDPNGDIDRIDYPALGVQTTAIKVTSYSAEGDLAGTFEDTGHVTLGFVSYKN